MATETLPPPTVWESPPASLSQIFARYFARLTSGSADRWDLKTLVGLFVLVVLWAAWMYGTWERWGNLTIDSGREMYVPTVLSEGKTLYRDIWYLYGPLAPYWNSFLYRLFGVHLNVLYWAGSLSALLSAILLYLAGMRMSAWLAGWTAGAVLLIQSFHPSLFSFPLPYSFASVYGCLIACLFLWFVISASTSSSLAWVFGAGTASAVALLLRLDMGAACYISLMVLIAARGFQQRSWKSVVRDIAVCLPGVAACAVVISWMISLGGSQFLTQENLMSWPTSFFMRTYGKFWLAKNGLEITGAALMTTAAVTFLVLAVLQGLHLFATWNPAAGRWILLRVVLCQAALTYLVSVKPWDEVIRHVFFPQGMVLYVAIAAIAAWWYFWRQWATRRCAAIALTLTFSSLLAFRTLLKTKPWGYAIYYDGPAILSYLLLLRPLIPRIGRVRLFLGEGVIYAMCLTAALLSYRGANTPFPKTALLTSERGNIRVSEQKAENYRAAISFMKEKHALGEAVLSVPEDTSLYFFSGTHCPTRVFAFTPGMLAPGKMTAELISEMERKHVRYLIWSNRTFPEYGVPSFGTDFDRAFGDYLGSRYQRVGPITPMHVASGEWTADVWERRQEAGPR